MDFESGLKVSCQVEAGGRDVKLDGGEGGFRLDHFIVAKLMKSQIA